MNLKKERITMKKKMTSQERVLAVVNPQTRDKVPVDLGARLSSDMSAIAYSNLLKYIGKSALSVQIYDVVQQLAKPHLKLYWVNNTMLVMVKRIILLMIACIVFPWLISLGANPPQKLRVGLLQLNPVGLSIEENLKKGEGCCRRAKEMGADIVLFPEIWSNGYSRYHWPGTKYTPEKYPLTFEEWKGGAIDTSSAFIKHYCGLAKELEMAIVITYLEKWDRFPRNSASVITASGEIIMTYAKVHTSDMLVMESNCTPGDDFYVCPLPVNGDTVKVGIMICFDREFPESARILMLKGAELILTPNACTLDEKMLNQFQTRAVENAVGVAMANYASPTKNGYSCAFDANGDKILVAEGNEGVYIAEFDLDKIRAYRQKTIWGNAYRRPGKYKALTSSGVESPFIRMNGKGEVFDRDKR
jgi:predicted amidohydrolase